MTSSGSILGHAVLRLEDPTLVTGTGKYLDDLVEPGMLHVAFVRSMVAHGVLQGSTCPKPRQCLGFEASSTPVTTSGCRRCRCSR